MIGNLTIDPETGEVTEQEVEATTPINKTINKQVNKMIEHLIFNTDFIQNTKPAPTLDPFLQSLVEETATKNARSIETKARQNALRCLLAKGCKTKGGIELRDILGRLRQLWMEEEMGKKDPTTSGISEANTLNFVFNSVLSGVLREVATRLTQGTARDWDEELHDLNHEFKLEVYPTQNIGGGVYQPVTMESISFMPEPVAGKAVEDYAGTNPFEM
jgi:hypothetical protein